MGCFDRDTTGSLIDWCQVALRLTGIDRGTRPTDLKPSIPNGAEAHLIPHWAFETDQGPIKVAEATVKPKIKLADLQVGSAGVANGVNLGSLLTIPLPMDLLTLLGCHWDSYDPLTNPH